MKRFLFIAAIAAPLAWTACSGDKTVTEDVVPKGMKAIDLGLNHDTAGFPLKINVPDSTYYPIIETTETPNGVEVKIGQHFNIVINHAGPGEDDIAKMKPVIEAADELPKTFTTSDSLLRWETKIGDNPMNHFYYIKKIGNDTYFVRDNNNNPDNEFKKEEVDRMIESAKSLRARPAAPAKA